jgi:hypothetical protein
MRTLCSQKLLEKLARARLSPGRRPYACDECGKTYVARSVVNTHKLQVHKKARDYGCVVCPKVFPSWQALERHQRVHNGERPFKSTESMRRFHCYYRHAFRLNFPSFGSLILKYARVRRVSAHIYRQERTD